MCKNGKDLLLAKRRVLAMLPFIIINFSFAIIMLVFSAIAFHRVNTINEDYQISSGTITEISSGPNDICKEIIRNINNELYHHNFTQIFMLDKEHDGNHVTLEKFIESISVVFAFSINAVVFFTIFLLISIVFYCIYAKPSDEVIKANPKHLSNRNHCLTTCFIIFKTVSIILIELYLVIYTLLSISYQSNVFENVHVFYEKCTFGRDKNVFKNKYKYCWELNSKLNVFYIFTALFIFADILSIIITILSKHYNVWSLILNKISRGKYEYEDVDVLKGFIVPQGSVVKDDEAPEEDLIGAINDVNDDQ